jgi:aspartate ammonia-lyase
MAAQDEKKIDNAKIDRVKSLLTELEIKGSKKGRYLNTAKNNPDLVIEQLKAFKQYKADFNSELLELTIITRDGI